MTYVPLSEREPWEVEQRESRNPAPVWVRVL